MMNDIEREELRLSMAEAHKRALEAQDVITTRRMQDKDDALKLKELTGEVKKARQGALSPIFSIAMNWRNPQQVLQGMVSMIVGSAQYISAESQRFLHMQDMANRKKEAGFAITEPK